MSRKRCRAPAGGAKEDGGKVRLDLTPPEWSTLEGQIFTFGAQKYADHNWRKGIKTSRLYSAAQRHLLAWLGGEDLDPESGLPHVFHAAWNCKALYTVSHEHPECDDRWRAAK